MSEPWPDMWLDLEPWPRPETIKLYRHPEAFYPNGYIFYANTKESYRRGDQFYDDRHNLYEVRWIEKGTKTDTVYCQLLAFR